MTMQSSAGILALATLAMSWNRPRVLSPGSSTTVGASGTILVALLAMPLMMAQSVAVRAQDTCQVQEPDLRDAIKSYALACSLPRVDCDPIDGQWVCASFNMTNGQARPSLTTNSAAIVATAPTTTPPATTSASLSGCEFSAATLDAARAGYASSCSMPRVDCDPIDGQWICASYRLGSSDPGSVIESNSASANSNSGSANSNSGSADNNSGSPNSNAGSADSDSSLTESNSGSANSNAGSADSNAGSADSNAGSADSNTGSADSGDTGIVYGGDYGPPQRGWMDSYSANGRCYIASGFDHGIGDVLVDTPAGKRTVRQVATALGKGPGIANNPVYNDVQCGHGPANNAGDEDINQCPGRVDMGAAGCSIRGPTWDLSVFAAKSLTVEQKQSTKDSPSAKASPNKSSSPISGPSNAKSALPGDSRYQPGDLIGMHHDNSGDRDDGHATAAAKMVVSYYGLDKALHIVNGTYDARYPNGYNGDSEIVMNVTWGSEGSNASWWNADARPDRVRNETAAHWRQTLEAGHKVWLAEGGPSDFTADVLRQLEATTKLDLKNIHIIQHSGWNEDHTSAANISDVKRLASYLRIGDGNTGGNNTPDLNQANDAVARRFLSDVEFGPVWRAAMNYLPVFNCSRSGPHCKFDGSDAVALMWIVGVESDEIRNWSDFASRYAN